MNLIFNPIRYTRQSTFSSLAFYPILVSQIQWHILMDENRISLKVLCMMKCRHVAWTGLMVCSCVPKHLTWIKTDSFASKSVFFYIYLTANDGIPNISLRNFRICQVVAGDRCSMEIFTAIRSTTAIWTCLGLTLEKENTEGWERNVISKST